MCDPTYAIHQAELLAHGKHPKVNVPQWRADPQPDPGQLTVCDYTCFVSQSTSLTARASSEPAAAKMTVPEPV